MYPEAYLKYLVHFHCSRDYFECHEVLEDHWKSEKEKRRIWIGLIQIAVGLYHHRRGNRIGAQRMLRSSIDLLQSENIELLGLDKEELLNKLKNHLAALEHGNPYVSISLPIIDGALLLQCKGICAVHGWEWGRSSDLNDHYLINKHSLRDRTEIVEERNRQIMLRNKEKKS